MFFCFELAKTSQLWMQKLKNTIREEKAFSSKNKKPAGAGQFVKVSAGRLIPF
jgi:hypothetical protein